MYKTVLILLLSCLIVPPCYASFISSYGKIGKGFKYDNFTVSSKSITGTIINNSGKKYRFVKISILGEPFGVRGKSWSTTVYVGYIDDGASYHFDKYIGREAKDTHKVTFSFVAGEPDEPSPSSSRKDWDGGDSDSSPVPESNNAYEPPKTKPKPKPDNSPLTLPYKVNNDGSIVIGK